MVMCCPLSSCDEHATVFNRDYRVARKVHTCEECREPIAPGTRYEYVSMLFDGAWSSFKTCMLCAEIGDHFNCGGRTVGTLWEELEENFFPDMRCGGPCMDRLSVAAKVALIDARMEWLLGQDEIRDHGWDGFPANKDYQKPLPDPLVEQQREQKERALYDRERELDLRSYYWDSPYWRSGAVR